MLLKLYPAERRRQDVLVESPVIIPAQGLRIINSSHVLGATAGAETGAQRCEITLGVGTPVTYNCGEKTLLLANIQQAKIHRQ